MFPLAPRRTGSRARGRIALVHGQISRARSGACDSTAPVTRRGVRYSELEALARSLRRHVVIVAYDARGHWHTHAATSDPAWDEQLDMDTQVSDARALFGTLFPSDMVRVPQLMGNGHSISGSIAIHHEACVNAAGMVDLDVVEGMALSALPQYATVADRTHGVVHARAT